MNKELKNLIRFIKNYVPEINKFDDNSLLLFIDERSIAEFLDVTLSIDGDGCLAYWKGSYFCIEIDGFIIDRGMSINEFLEIIKDSKHELS